MDINDLTVGQAKELAKLFGGGTVHNEECPYAHLIGKNVIVRTVTMIYTGQLCKVGAQELTLSDVSWIPETERYAQFVATGAVRECEPYPDGVPVLVGRGSIVDVVQLRATLPRSQI
jgi:hypothetical protein